MAANRQARLRVGVIGLGRLWEARHKPALAKLHDRFQVTAVYDQVLRRALIEARSLGCHAAEGLHTLIDRPDVDAVYLLGPQWFGLHPIEAICRAGKPIYCALPVAGEYAELKRLEPIVRASGVPFMIELARRFYPASLRLRELLATQLGRPRIVLGQNRLFGYDRYAPPGPANQLTPLPLRIDPGSYLLDWCRFLFQDDPASIQADSALAYPVADRSGADFETFTAHFPDGGIAQMDYYRYQAGSWGEASRFLPQPGFQVFAERGAAWLEMPDRIQWTDAQGTHEERLPLEPSVGETLNDHFYRLVRGQQSLAPSFQDALSLARLLDRCGLP
ncbi:MAG: Gfo/Idh/MocA family oxidoreductase [Isosphaeraceae bacterium]